MSISLKPLNVWLVDDDASIRWVLERALRQGGMSPTAFDQADSALAALRRDRPDVLITDIRMPGRSGLELLTQIRASQPELPVIVMTAHSDLDSAVAAYQGGAFEYLPKPFDIDHAVGLVRRAISSRSTSDCGTMPGTPELLGRAPAMQHVFRAISSARRRQSLQPKRAAFPRCSVRRRRCRKSSARSAACRARA
jgi:two-component system nitrogen regulation response regulator GlnG